MRSTDEMFQKRGLPHTGAVVESQATIGVLNPPWCTWKRGISMCLWLSKDSFFPLLRRNLRKAGGGA